MTAGILTRLPICSTFGISLLFGERHCPWQDLGLRRRSSVRGIRFCFGCCIGLSFLLRPSRVTLGALLCLSTSSGFGLLSCGCSLLRLLGRIGLSLLLGARRVSLCPPHGVCIRPCLLGRIVAGFLLDSHSVRLSALQLRASRCVGGSLSLSRSLRIDPCLLGRIRLSLLLAGLSSGISNGFGLVRGIIPSLLRRIAVISHRRLRLASITRIPRSIVVSETRTRVRLAVAILMPFVADRRWRRPIVTLVLPIVNRARRALTLIAFALPIGSVFGVMASVVSAPIVLLILLLFPARAGGVERGSSRRPIGGIDAASFTAKRGLIERFGAGQVTTGIVRSAVYITRR